jgi:hypothetical protein
MSEAAMVIFQDIMLKTCNECRVECTEERKKQCIEAMRLYADRKAVNNRIIASLNNKIDKEQFFH